MNGRLDVVSGKYVASGTADDPLLETVRVAPERVVRMPTQPALRLNSLMPDPVAWISRAKFGERTKKDAGPKRGQALSQVATASELLATPTKAGRIGRGTAQKALARGFSHWSSNSSVGTLAGASIALVIMAAAGRVLGKNSNAKYEATAYEISVAQAAPMPPQRGIRTRFAAMLTSAPAPWVTREYFTSLSAISHLLKAARMKMNTAAQTCTWSMGLDAR